MPQFTPLHSIVTAEQWDGSQSHAEEIVDWVKRSGFDAYYLEKGRLDYDMHASAIVIDDTIIDPSDYVALLNFDFGFAIYTKEEFEATFAPISE